jgi:hypothetical protein
MRFTCSLLHVGILLGLVTNPDDVGEMYLRNVGSLSMDYMALYPGRYNSAKVKFILILKQ